MLKKKEEEIKVELQNRLKKKQKKSELYNFSFIVPIYRNNEL